MRSLKPKALAALIAVGVSVAMANETGPVTTLSVPDTNAAPTRTIAPTRADLPYVAAEVVRMSEAGVNDDLITAYIEKSGTSYSLDADEVVYLHDLGLSSTVLKALVDHSQSGAVGQVPEVSGATEDTQTVPADQPPVVTGPLTPPVTGAATEFYESLSPYGTWVDVPGYGWSWQPTVVAVNSSWQPYCNDGSWLWTDNGWYWNSYYSWGWAPFHYGRWYRYPRYGWLWCPDNVWGPAWVTWRDYPGYCGWAPLPPGAYFNAGIGWTFNGVAVGFNFGFGLGFDYFTFCDYNHFFGRHSFEHFHHGHDAERFFHGSRVHNDFGWDSRHGFINRGIDRSRIEAATGTRIREVAVREMPRGSGRFGNSDRPDRLTRSGGTETIYRPGRDIASMGNGLSTRRNQITDGPRNSSPGRGRGMTSERMAENTSRFQATRPDNSQRSAPRSALNRPQRSGNSITRPQSGAGNSRVIRPTPGSGGSSTRSAPAWRSTPSPTPRNAPSYTPRSSPRSAPSYTPRSTPSYSAPRVYTPRSTPSYSAPSARSYTPRSTPSYSAPRVYTPRSAPSYTPRSAPSFSAPRSFSRSSPSFGGSRPSGGGSSHSGGGGGSSHSGGHSGGGQGGRR